MSHGKLREDKTCLNCGHIVEERFCPHCGQENIETRQPAHFLFTHFIEDFTHYDGQFWKTIKYLLFRPGKLTKEYIAGKRQLYVAPVKLYIFISFITFLLPSFLPGSGNHSESEKKVKKPTVENIQQQQKEAEKTLEKLQKEKLLTTENANAVKKVIDTINKKAAKNQDDDFLDNVLTKDKSLIFGARNMKQYDSLHAAGKEQSMYAFFRPFVKKTFELKEKGLSKDEIRDKFVETFVHTLPKALFVYMPFFAFFLWVFHNKKKWWYFDHGIFTLHYFSFLLLGILIYMITNSLSDYLDFPIINLLFGLLIAAIFIYLCIYFFIAHHRVYETKRRVSILKGAVLFTINFIGLLLMLIILSSISFLMIH
jgi:hypothetical protein